MPINIDQLQREHQEFLKLNPDRQLDLGTYAKAADDLYGTPGERQAGYDWGVVKQLNTGIDRIVAPVAQPMAAGGKAVGAKLDEMLGTGDKIGSTLESVAGGLPRFAGEAALTAIAPEAQALRGVGLLAKGLGYGSAYVRGTAEHDSPVGGAIEVATLGAGNVLLPKLDKLAVDAVNKKLYARLGTELEGAAGSGAEELAKTVASQTAGEAVVANTARTGARIAAGGVGGTALGEVNRQAQLTVDGAPLSERNPFTVENIVGNVAGAVGFAPIQIAAGLRRPTIDLERTAKVSEWAKSTGRIASPAQDSFGSALDLYIDAKKNGDGIAMSEAKGQMQAAEKVTMEATKDGVRPKQDTGPAPDPVAFMANTSNLYNDAVARGVLPSDLGSFVKSVNETIDQRNLASTAEAKDAAFFGREVDPVGPSAEAVKQLQAAKALPQITPEWLQTTFDKQLARSLNEDPVFAYKAMVTEVSNQLLNMFDDAHAKFQKEQTAGALKPSRDLERENSTESEYIDSLAKIREMSKTNLLPPDIANELLKRHIEIVNRVGMSREGIEGSGYSSWRSAVIEAVNNYDPTTGKTEITFGNKKKGELITKEIAFEDLTRRNKDGGYIINPKFRRFTKGQGGRSTKEVADVGFTSESPTPSDVAQAQVYEDYGSEAPQWTDDGVVKGDTGQAVPVEDNIPADAVVTPSASPENAVATRLKDTLASTDSMAIFKQLEPWMRPNRSQPIIERSQKFAKEAFGALLDLMGERSYVSKESVDFTRAMLGEKFDALVKKSGEREAVRVAVNTFWDKTAEGMWKRFRTNEPYPTEFVKKFEPIIERLLGPKSLDELKVSRAGWETDAAGGQIGLAAKNRVSQERDINVAQAFTRFFRNQGYEAPLADHFSSIATRMTLAYNDIRFKFATISPDDHQMGLREKIRAMDASINDLRVAGVYSQGFMGKYAYEKNPLIALALEHSKGNKDPFTSAFMLSVLGHEIIHGVEAAANGNDAAVSGPYQAQRVDAFRKMMQISETMGAQSRYDMLTTIAAAVFPDTMLYKDGKIRPDFDGFLRTASTQANETINLYGQMLILGKVTNTADNPTNYARKVTDWLKWQPEEIQHFTQGFYRDLSDQAAALAEHVPSTVLKADMVSFHESASKMLVIEDVQSAKRMANMLVANLSGFPDNLTTVKSGIWTKHPDGGYTFAGPQFMANAERLDADVTNAAKDYLWSPPGTQIGKLSYLMPFFQLLDKLNKRGVPLAGDVWNLLSDVQPGYGRVQTRLLDSLLLRTPDGKLKFDDNNPLLRLAGASQKDGPARLARNALNDILRWQQDNDAMLAVTRDAQGVLVPSREARPFLEKKLASVPVELRQTLLAAVDSSNRVYQASKGVLFDAQVSKATYRVARLMQTLRGSVPYDVHMQTADMLVKAALQATQDVSNPNVPPAAKFVELAKGVDPVFVETVGRYFFDGEGIAPKLVELKEFLDSRPGFASEQRAGRFLIESVSKDGKREVDGAETQSHVKLIQRRLTAKGSQVTKVVDKNDARALTNFDAPDQVYEKAAATEQANWEGFLGRMEGRLTPDQLAVLKDEYVPGEGLAKEMSVRGLGKFTQERQFVGGRERLDYIDTMRGYVQSLAGSVTRTEARNKMRLMMNDNRLTNEVDFKARALQQLDWVMTPDSELAGKVKTGLAAYYLGGNLSSMLIEGTQSAVTLVPQLLAQGGRGYGLGSAWRTVATAASDAWSLGSKDSIQSYVLAGQKIRDGKPLTPTEERTYWFRKALDDGILDHGAIQDTYDRDQRALMARKFGHGDYGDTTLSTMVGNKVYQGAQFLLAAYGKMSNFNQKVAFAAGLKQGQELGLAGEKLYEHARRTKDLSMFGGGKANQPGALALISNPSTKSALGVMYTLQQYGLGMTSHLIERANESFGSNTKLNPVQRMQAKKAFVTMVATQTALAGALGLPFVGATLAVIEKLFGVNANAAVREGLASLAGDDEQLGGLISELALDGIASHTLGVDVGSRVGVSNLLGTSAYRGFAFQDMLGPAPSVIGNMVNAVGEVSRGNMWEGARQLVPAAFKNAMGLRASQSQYGDLAFRDKSSNLLYEPSGREAAAYAIGFRPRELAQKQRLQGLLKTSDDLYAKSNDTKLDTIARSLRSGDTSALETHLNEVRLLDPMFDEKSFVSQVINRAVNMDVPVDPLATGNVGNQAARRKLAGTFDPSVVDRRDETAKALRADELNAATGYRGGKPITPRELMRASMLDSFVSQGMTRNEALRQLELMRL